MKTYGHDTKCQIHCLATKFYLSPYLYPKGIGVPEASPELEQRTIEINLMQDKDDAILFPGTILFH